MITTDDLMDISLEEISRLDPVLNWITLLLPLANK